MIQKYSQLHLGVGATKEQLVSVANKLNMDPKELLKLVQEVDISGKRTYEVWLLKQVGLKNIRLPEDKERVQKTLKDFEQLNNRRQLKFTNINQYPKIHDLEEEIRSIKGDTLQDAFSFDVQKYLQLPGVEIYGQNSEWLILKVSNVESLMKTSDSTEWCTLGKENATRYIQQDGAQYVVFKKKSGKLIKFAMFSPDFEQFKNIYDEEIPTISDSLYELAVSKLKETWNIVKRNGNKIYSFLEKNPIVNGNLDLRNTAITNLPEGLTIEGYLNLSGTAITSLPKNLKVNNWLNLRNTPITSLSEGLSVGGDLDLSYTPITNLSEGLKVGRNLDLSGTKITSLPEDLMVEGDLYLNNTPITSLPEDLMVEGDLYLNDTPITSLPEGLSVGGFLNLSNTSITSLPKNLNVRGGLGLSDTAITNLPEDLKIEGHLDLSNTVITSLPANLNVGGELDLSNSTIKSLPENLKVGGSLDLRYSAITSLPEDLMVEGDLYLNNTPITSLPEGLSVGGFLDLSYTHITSLPANLNVGGGLDLNNTAITSLPEDLIVGGKLYGTNPLTNKTWQKEYDEMKRKRTSSLRRLNVK